jgi:hypothetical protein|tara:strand:+ start:1497 stop:3125 length:1629 start_codon:yes stop_codon:yes gene_type:complete
MVSRDTRTTEEVLTDEIGEFFDDPLGYVMFCFPWEEEASLQLVELAEGVPELLTDADRERQAAYRARFPGGRWGPDLWQCDFLDELGREIRAREFDGRTPVDPVYFTTVSGHEIGKTTLVAWLIKFILDTRPMSTGSVTAVTDEQLRTKTWAELGKWHHMSLTSHWFKYSSGRGAMTLVHVNPKYGKWRCDARTPRKEKSESFAGQHAPTATSFYVFDEASGVADKIFEVREGGLTSGEPMVFDFGNGTQNTGTFFEECEGRLRERYIRRSIDSRTVAITNKKKIADDIRIYGPDSDLVRVRWLGLFPRASTSQFIATDVVEAAQERELVEDPAAPVVLGVDVARFGDDKTVIYPRLGNDARSFPPRTFSGLDTMEVVEQVVNYFNYFVGLGRRPQMIFVDDGSMGGGVVDRLRQLNYPVMGVAFGAQRFEGNDKYRFKGDKMWGDLRDAMPSLCIIGRETESGQRLHEDLTQRQYGLTISGDKINLESKTVMKTRGLRSPDEGDALALTYAQEVFPELPASLAAAPLVTNFDYDPHEGLHA